MQEREEHRMKKKIFGLLVMLVFAMSSCTVASEPLDRSSETYSESGLEGSKTVLDETSEVSAENTGLTDGIKVLVFSSAGGSETEEIVTSAQDHLISEEGLELPKQLPVYRDLYPTGQEGPLYDVNEEVKNLMEQNLTRYLRILYKDDGMDFAIDRATSSDLMAEYTDEVTDFGGGANFVNLLTSGYNLVEDITMQAVEENELVEAAVQYLGLTNPSYQYSTILGHKGDIMEYTCVITESVDDITEYAALCDMYSIHITCSPSSSRALLLIKERDMQEVDDQAATVSYEEALDYIQEKYPDANPEDIKVEVQYNSKVEQGFLIPIYKFYVEQETITLTPEAAESVQDETASLCEVTYIQAVEARQ